MTYFIYARDGASQIVLKKGQPGPSCARELKEMGRVEVEFAATKSLPLPEPLLRHLCLKVEVPMSDTQHDRFQSA